MEKLAKVESGEDVRAHLSRLPAAYGEWIARQAAADVGGERRVHTRDELLHKAGDARRRIAEGIELLAADPQARRAFCLANEAMAEAALRRSPAQQVRTRAGGRGGTCSSSRSC